MDIAQMLGWEQPKVSEIENDKYLVKLDEICEVSRAYGVPVGRLVALPMGPEAQALRKKARA